MVAGILGWRRLLCKNVVFLLKTVLLAGWEFALRMIPARFRVLLQSVLSQVSNRGEAASRSALRRSRNRIQSCLGQLCTFRTAYYDHMVERHAPCQANQNKPKSCKIMQSHL